MVEHAPPKSFQPVLYKKSEGKLNLNFEGLSFSVLSNRDNIATTEITLPWIKVSKHQVSPANHSKSLLKIVLVEGAGKPLTFEFSNRADLEAARKEISQRLQSSRSQHSFLSSPSLSLSGNKRRYSDIHSPTSSSAPVASVGRTTSASFGELDPTSLAVTRSSLLAANPSLRAQHHYLVEESKTVEEDDFWKTHQDLVEEEYARIAGITQAGTSSLLRSHLSTLTGRITLGVEEMRQIFIMYPAVHKAYEEKVPLELSDEQFWRKYLESEYFHRDRGRIGAASRRNGDATNSNSNSSNAVTSKKAEEARAAAVGTDDLFSRYDQKLRESGQLEDGVFGAGAGGEAGGNGTEGARHKRWGTKLAVGQFDLASTFETERGKLLEGPRDNHPVDFHDDGKGSKVIQKYNRHWAMVLNPEDAVAGSNLMEVARKSVEDTIPDDEDAKAGGGLDEEMQRLVGYANARSQNANHALGIGESDEYKTLILKNTGNYRSGQTASTPASNGSKAETESRKKNALFASIMVSKLRDLSASKGKLDASTSQGSRLDEALPPPTLGKELLMHLTKKMASDSKTDADTLEVVNSLPEDFKKLLYSYFRRSSELLRHYFGLKRLVETTSSNSAYRQKLDKIKKGVQVVYNEMYALRDNIPDDKANLGVTQRKMLWQIMQQIDWCLGVDGGGSGSGGGGGFVTVEEF